MNIDSNVITITILRTALSSGFMTFVISILPQLFSVYNTYEVLQDQLTTFQNNGDKFDFIIVGAGSAGSVLANRLSENFNVLVLEGGGYPNPMHRIPLLSVFLLNMPHEDWGYYTVPQKNACLALNFRQSFWPRGRSLGGSSNLNFMIYLRGHRNDYERWANVSGDSRWRYENVLRLFKKSENYKGEWNYEHYHSQGGNLHVRESPYKGMSNVYCKAAEEMGIPRKDLNADFVEGCSPIYNTQEHGTAKRHGTYHAFFVPVKGRRNLTIRKFSHVTKILFWENRPVGVEYIRHDKRREAYASKETILQEL